MTPEQALQLLDQAVASLHVNRADHVQLQTAINSLMGALQRLAELQKIADAAEKVASAAEKVVADAKKPK